MLQLEAVTIKLPVGAERAHAVRNVSFSVSAGEVVCLVGESGSGKSVLAHAIVGLNAKGIEIEHGSITFEGKNLCNGTIEELRELRQHRVGMVFQDPMSSLNPLMRVSDQILEAIPLSVEKDRRRRWQLVRDAIQDVGLADAEFVARAYPHRLSGGQRQRIMIAMALVRRPDLLILDEPTTALDVTTQAQILLLVRNIQQERGMTVIFITHDFGVVADIAERVIVMRGGELIESGPAQTVLTAPRDEYVRGLLAAVPRFSVRSQPQSTGALVLEGKALCKTYERKSRLVGAGIRVEALSQLSFAIRRGQSIGIVGESGSGKSTLARVLCGLVRPDSGTLTCHFARGTSERIPAGGRRESCIQMIFQDPYGSLNPKKTVFQILTAAPLHSRRTKEELYEEARSLLALVSLPESALYRRPHEFSGGQRQRIAIARALGLKPEILIADEPVSALDVTIQAQILGLVGRLQKQLSFALVFITHDLRVAAQVCDQIIVMQQGRIVEAGEAAQVLFAPSCEYTKNLVAAIPGRRMFGFEPVSNVSMNPYSPLQTGEIPSGTKRGLQCAGTID